jgi:hypothetical protein
MAMNDQNMEELMIHDDEQRQFETSQKQADEIKPSSSKLSRASKNSKLGGSMGGGIKPRVLLRDESEQVFQPVVKQVGNPKGKDW